MSQRITIDPITRIEGHLRIDLEVDGGVVKKAYSAGTMWRGIEVILKDRDPRDAWVFTQRICGVCTTVHAIASVRSVENALGLEIPLNAQLIRNLIVIAHALHDHIVHFYHLSALDWVDVTKVLEADPQKASDIARSYSDWPGNSVQALAATKEKVKEVVASGQLGIFTNGYWGHKAMKLPPEVNLIAVAHYLQALEVQRKALQVVAILGSKTPNIQNLAVGGVANAINLDNPATLNMEKLYTCLNLLQEVGTFVKQCYVPDVCRIAAFYPEWFGYGAGVKNYLCVPDLPTDAKMTQFDLPGGIIMGGDLGTFKPVKDWNDQFLKDNVQESITRSLYKGDWSKKPWDEETDPITGEDLKKLAAWPARTEAPQKYSWVKAPRLAGNPMQVGPLAQVLAGVAAKHEPTVKWAMAAVGLVEKWLGSKVNPAAVLQSTLGRHAARAIRTAVIADLAEKHWKLLATNVAKGGPDGKGDVAIFADPMPKMKELSGKDIMGVGFHEAPRGTLSHWCVIREGKLKNYQAVVPSTWNAGPRDAKDVAGPYEASLQGNPIADPERPLEALRTVHSFDPCLACAIHTHDAEGNEISRVKVL